MSDTPVEIPQPDPDDAAQLAPLFDFDAVLAEHGVDVEAFSAEVVARFKAFGTEWKLIEPSNILAGFKLNRIEEDPAVLIDYVLGLVHPNERTAFALTIKRLPSLDVKTLMMLFNAMQEAILKRPTSPQPAKRRGSRTPARAKR